MQGILAELSENLRKTACNIWYITQRTKVTPISNYINKLEIKSKLIMNFVIYGNLSAACDLIM